MDVSKDSRIIQYACTITGLTEYHLMKETLEEVFGEGELVNFENVESLKKWITDTYSDKELEFVTNGDFSTNNTEEDKKIDEEEEEKESKNKKFTSEEITKHLSKFSMATFFSLNNFWLFSD